VADGRKLPRERVDAIAQGRVWTGAQALDLHLVDSLGGYEVAFDAARQLAGLPDDAPITIIYPRAGSLLSELRSYFSVAQASLAPSLGSIQGTADIIALLQSLNIAGAVQMSPINIR
jgi:protease-4